MNEFNNIQVVPQPKNLRINLYRHQLASIYNMERLEIDNTITLDSTTIKYTKIGVNADITGYGKSLSMIGLILRNKMPWDTETPYVFEKIKIEAESLIKTYDIQRYNRLPCTLILVSQSIIGQWEQELKHTDLKYICIKTKNDLTEIQAEEYDIILVIPSMYNKLVTVYSKCAWKRFIFDEPGNVKVPGMINIKAGFYWFITATPNSIFHHHYRCNKTTFMRDIIGSSYTDFEYLFKDIIIKNHPDFIKASFEMPKTYHHYYHCFQPIYNVIHAFVSDNIKSMIESGDIEGAIMSLGGDRTSNIVEIVLEKKKKEIKEIDANIQLYSVRNNIQKINELENKKEHINHQISELDIKFKNMLKDQCNICYDTLKKPVMEINCQNLFCGECLLKWIQNKNTCPLCRIIIDNKKLVYISEESDEENKDILNERKNKNMTKLEKIIDIINRNREGKYLIFSDHDKTFNSISTVLDENSISHVHVRGNVKTTEKNLDSFKHGSTQVIFLNSKYNGAGINLQEATDIILYHAMNFNTETQIIGRANRIGRKIPLNVHHLQIRNE